MMKFTFALVSLSFALLSACATPRRSVEEQTAAGKAAVAERAAADLGCGVADIEVLALDVGEIGRAHV